MKAWRHAFFVFDLLNPYYCCNFVVMNEGTPSLRKYKWADMTKFAFALLIPFLHVEFGDPPGIEFVAQYFSRLGVPFFFGFSGMMLARSVENRGRKAALGHYLRRIALLLLVWFIIDSYYIVTGFIGWHWVDIVQLMAFKTPGFLWFLVSMLVASIPFCLIRNDKTLYVSALVCFLVGMVLSESYSWLFGSFDAYDRIFLTSRNGIFFAFPIMCAGKLAYSHRMTKCNPWLFLVLMLLLFAEITMVGAKALPGADRSLYFMFLPFVYYLLRCLVRIDEVLPLSFDTTFFGDVSVLIYLMQFNFICTANLKIAPTGFDAELLAWLTYAAIVIVPCLFL